MKTFKEAFDLLTRAYISGQVDPWNCTACFVGNLLNSPNWREAHYSTFERIMNMIPTSPTYAYEAMKQWREGVDLIISNGYTVEETKALEENFLQVIEDHTFVKDIYDGNDKVEHPNYENALFLAFESTLELLKRIHISKGEDVDGEFLFTKRQLQTA
jgi:hypothetical protein